ncbi:helix-turn-helix domain-containing protein [Sphingomonas bacterium]|uniref:helix-turn-helix domain-containing protein n=1 Tax=Sphingomonas bacterium TaxID=1895847 RepID=UPI0015758B3C|nr:helix-turn-helix transcriptional regulator [Sphingomonas bacterium]
MERAVRLSPRQRQVLELYWTRRATSKEIARELCIARSTVDGYFAEALEALDAKDRREAALLVFGPAPLLLLPICEPPPAAIGDMPARVSPPPTWTRWVPLRTGAHNDLSIPARLVAILALAFVLAIGFGAFAGGVRAVSDLLR